MRVLEYFENSNLRALQPGETPSASHGVGLLRGAERLPKNMGQEQGVDVPSLVVELHSRQDQSKLGSYLLSPHLFPEPLQIEGKPVEIALRFRQIPKPLKLLDFRFDRYIGSDTAKNFSSEVELIDPNQNVDRTVKISMNNPLRYYGDTPLPVGLG